MRASGRGQCPRLFTRRAWHEGPGPGGSQENLAGATRDQAESRQEPGLLDSLVISQIVNVWRHRKQSSEEPWLPRSPVPVTNPAKYRNTGKGAGEMPRWGRSQLRMLSRAQWCTPVILTPGRQRLAYLVTCSRGISVSAVEMGIYSFLVPGGLPGTCWLANLDK